MKTAGVAELKARLSLYLEQVKRGHEVLVTDRGRPVAKLVPVIGGESDTSRRERLIREGVLIPGRGRIPRALLRPPRGSKEVGRAVLDALLAERREGR